MLAGVPRPALFAALGSALLAAGCAGLETQLGEGRACVRTSQCAAGLVCSMGVCTSDRTGFGMGTVPMRDAGPIDAGPVEATDAGPIDAGPVEETDAGRDAGPPAIDAGQDAGSPAIDAGRDAGPVEETDAGQDAGPPAVDAGRDAGPIDAGPIEETDAGPPDVDAGP